MKPQTVTKVKDEITETEFGNLQIGDQFIGSIWEDGKKLGVSLELSPEYSGHDWWMVAIKIGNQRVGVVFLNKEKKEI